MTGLEYEKSFVSPITFHERGTWPYTANHPDLDVFTFSAARRKYLSWLIIKVLDTFNARWEQGDHDACDYLQAMLSRLAKERLSI